MPEITLSQAQTHEISLVYQAIEEQYTTVSGSIGLTCSECSDNCCDSYFLHYTYCEWAYLWQGLRTLAPEVLQRIAGRAKEYADECAKLLAAGERPRLICPLNEDGRCSLYSHRLIICRLHGIPSSMTRPDGQILRFPGCFRCQEIVHEIYPEGEAPYMDRTQLLGRIALLESELLGGRRHLYPRVKRTIAEMIVHGPPRVDKPFCQR